LVKQECRIAISAASAHIIVNAGRTPGLLYPHDGRTLFVDMSKAAHCAPSLDSQSEKMPAAL
jgi:hypothetical protein